MTCLDQQALGRPHLPDALEAPGGFMQMEAGSAKLLSPSCVPKLSRGNMSCCIRGAGTYSRHTALFLEVLSAAASGGEDGAEGSAVISEDRIP